MLQTSLPSQGGGRREEGGGRREEGGGRREEGGGRREEGGEGGGRREEGGAADRPATHGMVQLLVNVVLSQSMPAVTRHTVHQQRQAPAETSTNRDKHQQRQQTTDIQSTAVCLSLDIVGFLVFLPVGAELVNLAGHITLLLHIACLKTYTQRGV